MTAKEYLSQYGQARGRAQRLKETLARCEADAASISGIDYSKDRVQSDPGDGMADKVIRIEELRAETERTVLEAEELMLVISSQIEKVEDKTFSRILHDRYILEKPLGAIADSMHYSYVHTCRLHGWALQAFEKILKDVNKC